MAKVVYATLLVVTSGGVGLALISAWLHGKLYALDHDQTRKAMILILAGMAVTNGVLIYAIGIAGPDLPINFRTWLYIFGIVVMTYGFWWEVKTNIGRLAVTENEIEKQEMGVRMTKAENRLTVEEARNTDIEEAARRSLKRADAAEKREGS